MKHLLQIGFLILLFTITNCEKKDELINRTKECQIIGFVTEKCSCCWGWVIKVDADTIKSENIPNFSLGENTVFPINAEIKIGSKTKDCSATTYNYNGITTYDYYEIKEFTLKQ